MSPFILSRRASVPYRVREDTGAIRARICISTTYHPFLLVAKRVYRFSVYVQKLYDLAVGAPHWRRAAEIDAPGVALKIGIVLMRSDTAVVVQVLHHEILTGT